MEYWDLYNVHGEPMGISVKRGDGFPEGTYHRIVHIWIYNERQEFLIQKRASHLSWFPNLWATTTGSVLSGETDWMAAAYREVEEELGLSSQQLDLEFSQEYIAGTAIVTLFHGFLPHYMMKKIRLSEEVADIKWMRTARINALRQEGLFAGYNSETFDIAFRILEKF